MNNNIWFVLLIGGLITFSMRFSLIYLFGKFEIPETLKKALHYVPPAVLSAIIFPELFIQDGTLNFQLTNIRLLAGLIAIVTAWFSKNTLLTILVGMVALFILGWLQL
jgi:branched-subunit amino acid transport protein